MHIVIKNGRVIDPAHGIDKVQDVYIADGCIVALGKKPEGFSADRSIDARNRIVCPGLVDLSAHLREPGAAHKATIASETRAAAAAGITTLCCPPDTDPVTDTPAVVELIRSRAQQTGLAHVVPLGALTKALAGNELSEMAALQQAGCAGLTNARRPIASTLVMRRAMEYAATHGITVFLHAEDSALANRGCAHEGAVATRLGLPGIPESAETVALARDLVLIEQTGVRAHFCRLSSARAVRMIARAQHDGINVTADASAHHLYLTEMDIGHFNSQCHVLPPLRTLRDRDGLRQGLGDGTLAAICSDHQPHESDAKLVPFTQTEPGISALETLLPLTLRLTDEKVLTLSDALAHVTCKPAHILGLDAGTLAVGKTADICIFDPERYWTLSTDTLVSRGHNTPFLNWELKGKVTHTLLDGEVVYELIK
ncbi:MAG: dihydroorotase [Proteobacteria bacterium]|nr:dihydroorotase [Pseudomonadota bacterium]